MRFALLQTDSPITVPATPPAPLSADQVLDLVRASLDDDKAEDVVVIDLAGKTDFADYMVVASGRSSRHVASLAEKLEMRIKASGDQLPVTEGLPLADWVLVDAGPVVVHLFRPEVRAFYNLEKMWGASLPGDGAQRVAE
jgi:ribosome-associated protein